MNNRDVETRLKRAVEQATPDVRDKILEACRDVQVQVAVPKRRRRNRALYGTSFVAVAAVMLLVASFAFSYIRARDDAKVDAIIGIDVNPSIEIEINAKNRVISVNPLNDDAVRILADMELEGTQTKVAINAIIGSMLYNGYLIDDATSSILISVESMDEQKATVLRESLVADIDSMLGVYSCDAMVIGQNVSEDNSIDMLANSYGISQGKAELVHKIIEIDDSYSENNLAYMTITELSALLIFIQSDEYAKDHDENVVDMSSSVSIMDSTNRVSSSQTNNTTTGQMANDRPVEATPTATATPVSSISSNNVPQSLSANAVIATVSDNGIGTVSSNSVSTNAIAATVSANTVSANEAVQGETHGSKEGSVSDNNIQ